MPRNSRNNQGYDQRPPKKVKVKSIKPIGAGKAFALGLLAAFIIVLIAAVALIFVSKIQTAQEQARYNQMLSNSLNQVRDASVEVEFTPVQEIRQRALKPSANIIVKKQGDQAQMQGQQEGLSAQQQPPQGQQQAPQAQQPSQQNQPQQQDQGSQPNAAFQQGGTLQGQTNQSGNQLIQQSAGELTAYTYGSGVVIHSDGYILTNYHVVEGAKETDITVVIGENEYNNIDIAGYDKSTDLAVLKVEAKDLPVAQIGESGSVVPGDWTMSVGNPYNLNDTMSVGIISALDRNFTYQSGPDSIMYANMMQTTTALNEGCSGGGLYNAAGQLIGINTLVAVDEASSERIGYAIPIDFVVPIAKQLMTGQAAPHASLGMSFSDVSDKEVAQFSLESSVGATVTTITPSGPAETARIISGDIIIEYNGHKIKNAQDMLYRVRASVINTTVPIVILREGKKMDFTIKVGSDV